MCMRACACVRACVRVRAGGRAGGGGERACVRVSVRRKQENERESGVLEREKKIAFFPHPCSYVIYYHSSKSTRMTV